MTSAFIHTPRPRTTSWPATRALPRTRRKLRSTNALERFNRESGRRTDLVGPDDHTDTELLHHLPGLDSCQQLFDELVQSSRRSIGQLNTDVRARIKAGVESVTRY